SCTLPIPHRFLSLSKDRPPRFLCPPRGSGAPLAVPEPTARFLSLSKEKSSPSAVSVAMPSLGDMNDTTDVQDGEPYRPTTTHAEWGAGNPRLLITSDTDRFVHDLTDDLTRIGSAGGSEVLLAETDPLHATVEHDERDEYVLTLHGEGEMSANPHAAGTHEGERSQTLRTGARFTAGPWALVFTREEFADHGRPYGGREGG